jgi:sec-independent protein translocase protein TatC
MPAVPRLLRRRPDNPEGRMSVLDHLRELRRRLIIAILFIAVGAVVGWVLYDPVLKFLEHPYCVVNPKYRFTNGGKGCKLYYTGVLDGFTTRLKVSFIAGSVFSAPFWLYQIWGFITPGLRKNERQYTISFILISTVLFFAGMTLAYVVLSKGLSVLISSSGSGTAALLTVNAYLSFVVLMLVVFGAAFELPLLVVMANLAGVLPAKLLKKTQRIAIFLIFVFAAVATPTTDPFTMCAMAIPMVLLYEGAVLYAIGHDRRKDKRKAAERAEEPIDDLTPSTVDAIPRALPPATDSWSDTT